MKISTKLLSCIFLVTVSTQAVAEAPDIRTPAPVIHLADNLDEVDKLGWCIDTQGRGFAELLHAHSCKPQGGDVQFSYESETGLIRSVAYPDYCMAHAPGETSTFSLVNCNAAAEQQNFFYNSETGEISPANDETQCVVIGAKSRSAGPFMSRSLDLMLCSETPEILKRWTVIQ